jgi:hypothetical protein
MSNRRLLNVVRSRGRREQKVESQRHADDEIRV